MDFSISDICRPLQGSINQLDLGALAHYTTIIIRTPPKTVVVVM